MVTDQQVRKLMEEHQKTDSISHAAMKAGMDRKTARKYVKKGLLPSQSKAPIRTYRTRPDPFSDDWDVLTPCSPMPQNSKAKRCSST
jgi:hypothetical protein